MYDRIEILLQTLSDESESQEIFSSDNDEKSD